MSLKKNLITIVCILSGLTCLYLLVDFLIYTDEERISDLLDECKRGIEEENPFKATKYLSEDYMDVYGLTQEDLREIGEDVFQKFDDFKVIFEKKEIMIDGNKAKVNMNFRILIPIVLL